ncbi:MAG: 50S ribosomal protein L4 [Victivallales bacterium]|nr:50S ribosomal protein L4 [Victivallales bacterium]
MENKINILNKEGQPIGEFNIEDKWIELEKGEQAVHDVVTAFRAALRSGTASAKTRSEIKATGAKPYRQKGTGRARQGSSKSPILVGGGVAFGPKPRTYYKKINKKVRKLALKRAFSEKVKDENVHIVDQIDSPDYKTKNAAELLKKLKLNRKTLIVVKDYSDNTLMATGNLENVLLMKAASVNVYQLLNNNNILFSEDAIKDFVERL